jgi:hydrogenase-4 membrane subunit HyfE
MTNVLLIIFIISLLYVSIANRIITYVRVLALQGFILFGVTFLQLQDIQTWNLVLILLETIVFKALAVPIFLGYLIRRNKITRETEPYFWPIQFRIPILIKYSSLYHFQLFSQVCISLHQGKRSLPT